MANLEIENLDWYKNADCVDKPEIFIGPLDKIETTEERTRREELAKFICSGCVVSTDCHVFALRDPLLLGVWSGESETDRSRRSGSDVKVLVAREEDFKL